MQTSRPDCFTAVRPFHFPASRQGGEAVVGWLDKYILWRRLAGCSGLITRINRFKFVKVFTKILAKVCTHLVNTQPDDRKVRLRRTDSSIPDGEFLPVQWGWYEYGSRSGSFAGSHGTGRIFRFRRLKPAGRSEVSKQPRSCALFNALRCQPFFQSGPVGFPRY